MIFTNERYKIFIEHTHKNRIVFKTATLIIDVHYRAAAATAASFSLRFFVNKTIQLCACVWVCAQLVYYYYYMSIIRVIILLFCVNFYSSKMNKNENNDTTYLVNALSPSFPLALTPSFGKTSLQLLFFTAKNFAGQIIFVNVPNASPTKSA